MVSGIILSTEVFSFLPVSGGMSAGPAHTYMFLRTHLVFVDYEQPALLFFVQYVAIMELFAFLAYYGEKILRVGSGRKTK